MRTGSNPPDINPCFWILLIPFLKFDKIIFTLKNKMYENRKRAHADEMEVDEENVSKM